MSISESPTEWRQVVATSMDGVGVIDGDGLVHANEALADLHGYETPDHLLQEGWHACYESDERERIERDVLPGVREGTEWRGEATGLRADGSTFDQEVSLVSADDSTLVWVVREITRTERERELERYETLVESMSDVVYALDSEGTLIAVNSAVESLTGYNRADLLGEELAPLVLDEADRHKGERAIRRLLRDDDRTVESYEMEVITAGGERVATENRIALLPAGSDGRHGTVGVVRDITERKQRERELRAARRFNEELVENAPFGMFRLDEDLHITYENPRAEEIIGLPDEKSSSDAIGVKIHELPPIIETGQADLFTRLKHDETIEFEFPFESIYGKEAYFTGRSVPLYRDDEFDGAILMATDISERRRQERDLERQRDELETLNRINDLLLEITRELLGSPTREELERIVCERLAASALYQFAWIGELEADGSHLVPRASAGVDDGYIEAVAVTADETETGQGPGDRALRTGNVQVSQNIHTDPAFEPWREAALDRNVQSAAAVPLLHGKTTYGCLGVYATRPLAFSQREQAAFEVLGEAVGFAIHAIETRRLLFADAVLELEFQLTDTDQFLVRHSERFECALSVEGFVATKSGGWLLYVSVEGASPAALCEAAADVDALERVRVVRDAANDGLLEYRFSESPLLGTLAEAGVKLRSVAATAGRGRFVVEAPQSADVRRVVGRVRDVYSGADIVAQRERDRSVAEVAVPGGPLEDLTDRQRETLETAYHAGYFDWPRESTAEEVAESMGISAPTLHRHFRRAEKNLLSAFFDPAENTPKHRR